VLDLVCDSAFRCSRVQVAGDDGWLRGGRTVLDDGTPVLTWRSSGDAGRERHALAEAVDVDSPGALVALARAVARPAGAARPGRPTAHTSASLPSRSRRSSCPTRRQYR
jgi:hypothetical protein